MTGDDHYVFMDKPEAERIRRFLQLSQGWFRRHYLKRLEDGDLVVAAGSDGRCIFLDADGQCRVYSVRPLQCRTYPFWPEIVASAAAWRREARRCEGINQGQRVPLATICRSVKRCLLQQA
jgi:Fe-S-cluster containining protein